MHKTDKSSRLKLANLADQRKARRDEFLSGLAVRLAVRAAAAETAGDMEMAIELRAASEAVYAADFLTMALLAMETAHTEWEKLRKLSKH